MATPQEMVERLRHALAGPGHRHGLARVVMRLNVPELLGERGRYLGDDEYGPQYGYTRRQCKRLLRQIEAALADNAAAVVQHAVSDEEADLYTGDYDHE